MAGDHLRRVCSGEEDLPREEAVRFELARTVDIYLARFAPPLQLAVGDDGCARLRTRNKCPA